MFLSLFDNGVALVMHVSVCGRASPRRAGTIVGGDGISPAHGRLGAGSAAADDVDLARPVERQVEARSADDVSGSIVRTLYFADTFLMNGLYALVVCFFLPVCSVYNLYSVLC